MRKRVSAVTAGLGSLALAAGLVLVGGSAAHASTTPPYEPDPQASGSLALYDANGVQITSGNVNNPIATYAVGSATVRAGDIQGAIFGASPNESVTGPLSSSWNQEQWTAFTHYPLSSGPTNIVSLSQTHPVAVIGSNDETLAQFIGDYPNDPAHDSDAAYQNLYQVRLETANSQNSYQSNAYDALDVLVSGSQWTQVFPSTTFTITTTSLASVAVDVAYPATHLSATGGTGALNWSLAAGSALPTGMKLAATGVLSGTPTVVGTFSFTVQVHDAAKPTPNVADASLSVTIAPMTVTTTSLPSGFIDKAYTGTLTYKGGKGAHVWTLVGGSLPTGLKLATTGKITGTPTAIGTFPITVKVHDATTPLPRIATANLSITIAPMTITTASLPNGTVGKAYAAKLAYEGGKGTHTWQVISGSLPSGVKLAATGVFSGTPTAAGGSTFTVQVSDASTPTHLTATATFTITVAS